MKLLFHLLIAILFLGCSGKGDAQRSGQHIEFELHFQSGFNNTHVIAYSKPNEVLYSDVLTTDEIEGVAGFFKVPDSIGRKIIIKIEEKEYEIALEMPNRYIGINLNKQREIHLMKSSNEFNYD